ncbi:leucine--tRNA ligase [Paracrocinitomix mangrovi]|uniref:leucine--tRNA ligase n=1 Tax=Paracrocinitomix mangrovi TaxID=2862509 RepID=UPI001C8E8822|nr:class I tRNA ligase family protein [Paracrocinitomix mangrovi]UKN00386.1 leucine--tRNA ligase [Paracrocinitomix mangrovi]
MEYDFLSIEEKWQKYWAENKTYAAVEDKNTPKYYGLSMFPYPSGAGLHVGHPLGYIASCIYARYKKLKGFNVLHPMGYDSFGLPAEQYAIQTGQHPALTTEQNINRYREQLDKLGFSFDWDREVRTSDPAYYKWTQWIFKQLYNSWYNNDSNKAENIDSLVSIFEKEGNAKVNAPNDQKDIFSAEEWKSFSEKEQQDVLMNYRLTFLADSWVNWCPALGTVLANDEIKDGVSERGGHPVEQKLMKQWSMRITAYAERLLNDLETIEWSDSIKEQQRNWIGKSVGASVHFKLDGHEGDIEVFTTRPDTIFGVSFMVLAPEHELVEQITTAEYADLVADYRKQTSLKTERDRQSDVKNISGQFTGAFAIHPFTGAQIPVWIADYVLAGYGTGAVMAVPCGDQRDWDFAKHFELPIPNIFENADITEGAFDDKDIAVIANSDFLSGLPAKQAIKTAIDEIEKRGFGKGQTNYRLRDAVFSRQRYWGEPFPVYYKNDIAHLIPDDKLPVKLPEVDKYLPTEDGEPPLARAPKSAWDIEFDGDHMEYNTMPGWAGSSWYFLRYMDPHNEQAFVSKEKAEYWNQVDLYIGGSEHATGHLLYARFWTKFLFDMGYITFNEPFKKMINQGMILGRSSLIYQIVPQSRTGSFVGSKVAEIFGKFNVKHGLFISAERLNELNSETLEEEIWKLYPEEISSSIPKETKIEFGPNIITHHVGIEYVENDILNIEEAAKDPRFNYLKDALFIRNKDNTFGCGYEVDKMSKRWHNVVNPDVLCEKFGADTMRCYEMFLGPLEQSKPWDTQGINGVHNFLRKFWRLFHDADNNLNLSEGEADKNALKTLHKTIKKVTDDLDRFSFNTAVSNFMIATNELTDQKCNNKAVLRELVILLSPYAPHIAEELWQRLGETESVTKAKWPSFNPDYLVEASHAYPVSFNGKMRFKIELPTNLSKEDIEKEVLAAEESQKWLEGKDPKKVIVVPGKIVNVVI